MKNPIFSQLHVQENTKGNKGLFTRVAILKSSKVLNFAGDIVDYPNRFSLQIDANRHLNQSGDIDDFVNHACQPNCKVDFSDLSLVAIQNIEPGEELTLNYCASEYEISEPFVCNCGAKNCYGMVKGFAFLRDSDKYELRELLSPYLQSKQECNP